MSLSRLFLRLATVRALGGQTLAGDRVFDSAIDPLDVRIGKENQPVLVVYTDKQADTPEGRAHMAGAGASVELAIEISVAARATFTVDDGPDEVDIVIPHADEGMELTLDLIERQVLATLTGAQGVWPKLWRLFCLNVVRRESQRTSAADGAVRFAARQLVLTCETLIEPTLADPLLPGSAWEQFILAFEADAALAPLAPLLRAQFAGGDPPDWRRAAAALGVNPDVVARIGLGAMSGDEDDPALLEEATIIAGSTPLPPPGPGGWVGNGGPLNPETLAWLISGLAGNALRLAADGRLYVPQLTAGTSSGLTLVGDELRIDMSTLTQG